MRRLGFMMLCPPLCSCEMQSLRSMNLMMLRFDGQDTGTAQRERKERKESRCIKLDVLVGEIKEKRKANIPRELCMTL